MSKKSNSRGGLFCIIIILGILVFILSGCSTKEFNSAMDSLIIWVMVIGLIGAVIVGAVSGIKGTTPPSRPKKKNENDASVVGRAVVGGIIAGPTGAVIGAISAADKNAKNASNSSSSEQKKS